MCFSGIDKDKVPHGVAKRESIYWFWNQNVSSSRILHNSFALFIVPSSFNPVSVQSIHDVAQSYLTDGYLMTPHGNTDIGQQRFRCLARPNHYLDQCWLIASEVLWHSSEDNFTANAIDISRWLSLKHYWITLQHPHLPLASNFIFCSKLVTIIQTRRSIKSFCFQLNSRCLLGINSMCVCKTLLTK